METEHDSDGHNEDFAWDQREEFGRAEGLSPKEGDYKHSWLEIDDDPSPFSTSFGHSEEEVAHGDGGLGEPSPVFDFSIHTQGQSGGLWGVSESAPAAGEFETRSRTSHEAPFLSVVESSEGHFGGVAELFEPITHTEVVYEYPSLLVDADQPVDDRPLAKPDFYDPDAVRRFSPQVDSDTVGRFALGASPGVTHQDHATNLLPLESKQGFIKEGDAAKVESISAEQSSTLRPSVWATLRRVAAMGLRPGEILVETPLLTDIFEKLVPMDDQLRKPLVTTYEEVRNVLADFDEIIVATPPPTSTFELSHPQSSPGTNEALEPVPTPPEAHLPTAPEATDAPAPLLVVATPKLFDLRSEEASEKKPASPDLLEFPRSSEEEELDSHPFFTTMEFKNQAFTMTGSLDQDLDKVSNQLENESWSRGSDDVIVGRRHLRRRKSK